jgi:hypothetical protein
MRASEGDRLGLGRIRMVTLRIMSEVQTGHSACSRCLCRMGPIRVAMPPPLGSAGRRQLALAALLCLGPIR